MINTELHGTGSFRRSNLAPRWARNQLQVAPSAANPQMAASWWQNVNVTQNVSCEGEPIEAIQSGYVYTYLYVYISADPSHLQGERAREKVASESDFNRGFLVASESNVRYLPGFKCSPAPLPAPFAAFGLPSARLWPSAGRVNIPSARLWPSAGCLVGASLVASESNVRH